MTKSTFLKSSWIIISIFLFYCLIACGGSTDSGTGTTGEPTLQISSITASPTSLEGGRSSIITVTVTDSTGAVVSGETVTFSFVTTGSGNPSLPLSTGTTDGGGKAIGVYTAGTIGGGEVDDIVQATCGSATALITITRIAGASVGSNQVNLTADSTSLAATQSTILTATVTDSSNVAVPGATVAFAFATDGNKSGATDPPVVINGTTDASGRAYAIYTAGSLLPSSDLQDILTATAGPVTGPLTITRTSQSSSTTVTPGYTISLSASVNTLAAGEQSIITATVNNSTGNPVSGVTVNFAYVNKNSDASLTTGLDPFIGLTDVSGRVSTVYTAGVSLPGTTVQDSIKATVTDGTYSSTGAVIITRTGGTTSSSGFIVTLTPTPPSLAAGQSSLLVAEVSDYNGAPIPNTTVTFRFVTINSGPTMTNFSGSSTTDTTTPITATTDANGQAMVLYTAGTTSSGVSVEDAITASIPTGENSATLITRLPNAGTGNRLSLYIGSNSEATESTYELPSQTSDFVVTAKVVTDDGISPVSGASVVFSIVTSTGGTPTLASPSLTVTTGNDGKASVTFAGPAGETAGDAVIQASTSGGVGVGMVTWTVPTP
jgi:hypothetical protein